METTFGRPNYLFPPAEKVYAEIHQFCRQALAEGLTPVLMAYSLGKCQELLTGLTGLGVPVMLHTQCEVMTRVHEELGLVFPSHREFVEAEQAGHVVICPPLSVNSAFLKKIPKRRTAVATGWALDRSTVYRQQCDAAFPLSDHADYGELLQFVDLVKPRQVLTLHGFAADFAGTLRRRGVEALALGVPNQLELL
jgi:Cft2 family RNA processing exonuclease